MFALPLVLLVPKWWLGITASLFLITFLRSWRWIALYFCNIGFWILSDYLNWNALDRLYGPVRLHGDILNTMVFRTVIMLVCIIFFWSFLKLSKVSFLKCHKVALFYISFFGTAFFAADLAHGSLSSAVVWTILLIIGRFFWFFLYAVVRSEEDGNRTASLFVMAPFWSLASVLPIPGGLREMKKSEATSEEGQARLRLKATKMLYGIGISCLIIMSVSYLFVGPQQMYLPVGGAVLNSIVSHLPTLNILGRNACSDCQILEFLSYRTGPATSSSEYFLRLVGGMIYFFNTFLMILLVWNGACVAICRMSGFNVPRSINRPFEAKNFADFCGRWGYYYRQIIAELILVPIYSKLGFIKRSSVRVYTAIGFSILTCGLTYQFIVRIVFQHFNENSGLERMLFNIGYYLPYYMTFVVAIIFSELTNRKFKKFIPKWTRVPVYVLVYFIAYVLSLSMGSQFSIGNTLQLLVNILVPVHLFQ